MPNEAGQPWVVHTLSGSRETGYRDRSGSATWSPDLFPVTIFTTISLILACRPLYAAPDDISYIEYFSNNTYWQQLNSSEYSNTWLLIIDEPLWNIYTSTAGAVLGPEAAFRVTIFASAFLYLLFSARLAYGNWIITTLLFLFQSNIGSQMYYNQVRQGVALSVFLTLISVLRLRFPNNVALASVIAALIHSSFLAVLASLLIFLFKARIRIAVALGGVIILLGLYQYADPFELISLGRREGLYADAGKLNHNFYIVTLPLYGAIFYFLRPKANGIDDPGWYFLTLGVAASAIAMSFMHEAGARLYYISEAMICILLARRFRFQTGSIALGIWVFAGLIFIISDYRHSDSFQTSMIVRWERILSWDD